MPELYRITADICAPCYGLRVVGLMGGFYLNAWGVVSGLAVRLTAQTLDLAERIANVTPGLLPDGLGEYPDARPLSAHPLDRELFALLNRMEDPE